MSINSTNQETIRKNAASLKAQIQKVLRDNNKKADDRTVRLYAYALLATYKYNYPFGVTLKEVFNDADEFNPSIRTYLRSELNEKVFNSMMSEIMEASPSQYEALKFILDDYSYEYSDSTPESVTNLALRLLDIKPGENVVDLGSGDGRFLFHAADLYPESTFHGYEISTEKYLMSTLRNHVRTLSSKTNVMISNGDVFDLESEMNKEHGIRFEKVFSNCPFGLRLAHSGIGAQFLMKYKSRLPRIEASSSEGAFNLLIERLVSWHPLAKGVAIMPNGITWNASDKMMRRFLLEDGMIEAVISLPEKLLEYTSIPTTIIVFSFGRTSVRMIDATRIFTAGRRQNLLSDTDIDKIISAYHEDSDISRQVSYEEIWDNDFVLNPVRYLSSEIKIDNGVKLGSLLTISPLRGAQLNADTLDGLVSRKETDYQYLMLSNIHDGLIDDDLPYLNEIDRSLEKYCLQDGDIILSKNGFPFKVAIAHPKEGKQILANGNLFILRVDRTKVNPVYLKAFLEGETGTDLLKRISVGSTIPNISQKSLEGILIPLPSIEEQEKIAENYSNKQNEILILKSRLAKAISQLKEIVK